MGTVLDERQEELCAASRWDFSDLRAIFINCTLKRSPEVSNTQGLADRSIAIMRRLGVEVETVRAIDHDIATGVYPDMTEHGWERDGWPEFRQGHRSGHPGPPLPDLAGREVLGVHARDRAPLRKQPLAQRRRAVGVLRAGRRLIITGNEDGAKHCAMNILYSLQHLGFVIPPQADSCWLGEAGPGPSYLDPGSGGPENDFANRNTTFLTWNLLHVARMLKDAGGIPAHGNQVARGMRAAGLTTPTRTIAPRRS